MTAVEALRRGLTGHLSPLSLESAIRRHFVGNNQPAQAIARHERDVLAGKLEQTVSLFSATDRAEIRKIIRSALELDGARPATDASRLDRIDLAIRGELDVNVARGEARRIAAESGLQGASSVKVATAVSELARNVVLYAATGVVTIERVPSANGTSVRITCRDEGPGIEAAKLELIMSGRYVSKSGLGKGIGAVRRIADRFEIASLPGAGTTIVAEFRSA